MSPYKQKTALCIGGFLFFSRDEAIGYFVQIERKYGHSDIIGAPQITMFRPNIVRHDDSLSVFIH